MTPSERAFHRDHSRYMALAGCAVSRPAHSLVDVLVEGVVASMDGQRRPSTVAKLRVAVEAFLADLFAVEEAGKWARRSLDNVSFTGHRVSRRMFAKVRDALAQGGLIQWFKGFRVREFVEAVQSEASWGGQSCFKGTPALFQWAGERGIGVERWTEHFSAGRPKPAKEVSLVIARGTPTRTPDGRKQRGSVLPWRGTEPRALELSAQLRELNDYLFGKRVDGFAFAGLRRVFSNGDAPEFDWQWGGRFYSLPQGDAYEQWRGGSEARTTSIRLDGERVAEIDISACHLTILYGLAGLAFDPATDPYGIAPCSREAVKRYITVALGRGSSSTNGRWYARVREAVLSKHPILSEIERRRITSLSLQYHESEILLRAMNGLRDEHSLTSLPIHDGLIIPESARALAKRVLGETFRNYFRDTLKSHEDITPRIA